MGVTLSPETEELIREQMQRSGYADEDTVVRAALAALEQIQRIGDFEPGELDALLEEGESSEPLDGEKVLAEFQRLCDRGRLRHMP